MAAIKVIVINIVFYFNQEDARLLTQESELISNVQGVGVVDYDIDSYVRNMESVIKKKLDMYKHLERKIVLLK